MAFFFTHEFIAKKVLEKIRKKDLISSYENIDDFFFGAIAPDVHYINFPDSDRDMTHKPKGEDSIFSAFNKSNYSQAFLAGYETHLITDAVWSDSEFNGEKTGISDSIYNVYNVQVSDFIQKWSLYLTVDDYFQSKSNWFFQFECMGNIIRADKYKPLTELGFNSGQILGYKSISSIFLREPGIDALIDFRFIHSNIEERILQELIEKTTDLTDYLKEFEQISIEKSIESLEKNL